MEWTLAGYDKLGIVRQREGNRLSHSAPLDNYPTADGSFVCIVAGSDANFARLCAAMGRPELTTDPRFDSLAQRGAHGDEINGIVAAVDVQASAPTRSPPAASSTTCRSGPPTARPTSSPTPTWPNEGDLVSVEDPVIGPVRQQAPFPRLAKHPGSVPTGAPRLGEHNHEVWCGLVGISEAELDDLTARGVV